MDITGVNNSVRPDLLEALRTMGTEAEADPAAQAPEADLRVDEAATPTDARDPGETLLSLEVWPGEGARTFGSPSDAVPGTTSADELAKYVAGPLSGGA